jgi:hypothetical protein
MAHRFRSSQLSIVKGQVQSPWIRTQRTQLVLRERRQVCEASFERSQLRLKQNHDRELQLLEEKQAVALNELEQKIAEYNAIINRKKCVGQMKTAMETARLKGRGEQSQSDALSRAPSRFFQSEKL